MKIDGPYSKAITAHSLQLAQTGWISKFQVYSLIFGSLSENWVTGRGPLYRGFKYRLHTTNQAENISCFLNLLQAKSGIFLQIILWWFLYTFPCPLSERSTPEVCNLSQLSKSNTVLSVISSVSLHLRSRFYVTGTKNKPIHITLTYLNI
jgi:hypothetical protein